MEGERTPRNPSGEGYINVDLPDGTKEIIRDSAHPEYVTVPLVTYVDGERVVIGEAVLDGGQVYGTIGAEVGKKLLGRLFSKPAAFVLGTNNPNDAVHAIYTFKTPDPNQIPLPDLKASMDRYKETRVEPDKDN